MTGAELKNRILDELWQRLDGFDQAVAYDVLDPFEVPRDLLQRWRNERVPVDLEQLGDVLEAMQIEAPELISKTLGSPIELPSLEQPMDQFLEDLRELGKRYNFSHRGVSSLRSEGEDS